MRTRRIAGFELNKEAVNKPINVAQCCNYCSGATAVHCKQKSQWFAPVRQVAAA